MLSNTSCTKKAAPVSSAGSIGTFNGIQYIENPRAGLIADGGSGTVDVYQTLICGRQATCKSTSLVPPGFGSRAKHRCRSCD